MAFERVAKPAGGHRGQSQGDPRLEGSGIAKRAEYGAGGDPARAPEPGRGPRFPPGPAGRHPSGPPSGTPLKAIGATRNILNLSESVNWLMFKAARTWTVPLAHLELLEARMPRTGRVL